MSWDDPSPQGLGPPIAVRLIILLMVGWAITLAISAAIFFLLPPPGPGVYRLTEINAALRDGGSLRTRDGRPLERLRLPGPPPKGEPRLSSGIYRLALAASLNQAPARVRFERYPIADPVLRAILKALLSAPPVASGPPGSFAPPAFPAVGLMTQGAAPAAPPGAPAELPRQPFLTMPAAHFPLETFPAVVGEFNAAVQRPNGDWTVVRPARETFPNPWQQRIILWFVLCFGVLTPIGYVFARRLTAPIGLFAQAAERLGRDPRAPSMELSGPAEIGRAAAAFNEMQDRLKRYVEHRTAMIGAVAHDLRTPLSRIRFKIEGLPAEAREPIKRDIVQMEEMISAALMFVREATQVRQRELIDLSSAVACVVDSAALMGSDAKLTSAPPLVVHADGLALERLFSNLIDNAIKYGRRARVKVMRQGQLAVVEVGDSGPGIPVEELERVFEPFHRVDPSRCVETGGIGLGLSVARSIARAHGGDIELVNARQGLVARVSLPLPPEGPAPAPAPSQSPS